MMKEITVLDCENVKKFKFARLARSHIRRFLSILVSCQYNDVYTVRPNKKETRFISEISSLPRKTETNCILHYQEHFLFFHLIPNT